MFELNMWRAWGAVATTVASVSLSVYLISVSPWYLLPLAWAFAGTAWTGVRRRARGAVATCQCAAQCGRGLIQRTRDSCACHHAPLVLRAYV